MFCFAAAAAGGLPGGAGIHRRRRRWKSASSRRATWSATWISSKSIFGNAGDPFLPENDAGLDAEHWTGHTGCVILAPHLVKATKKSLGLPHWDEATERQRRDGMCWKDENEFYNNGGAFKITARDERGVIVTIIADNYFGYCKKEVKTQISYAANLYGLCEEEHAGGALVYPSYDLGEEFHADKHVRYRGPFLRGSRSSWPARRWSCSRKAMRLTRNIPDIIYVPRDVHFDLQQADRHLARRRRPNSRSNCWPDKIYIRPSGYRVRMEKPVGQPRLAAGRHGGRRRRSATSPAPFPAAANRKFPNPSPTPSFTGRSSRRISKRTSTWWRNCSRAITRTVSATRRKAARTRARFSVRNVRSARSSNCSRPSSAITRTNSTRGSSSIPQYLLELVFVVKRFYKPAWGGNWREHFSVDIINGTPGNELKCDNRKLVSNFLRVGYDADGSWRVFGLRKDFHPAAKMQMEDDITASVVVPAGALQHLNPDYTNPSVKFVHNMRDTACSSGRTRPSIAATTNRRKRTCPSRTISFPISSRCTAEDARELVEDAIGFDNYTEPMQTLDPGSVARQRRAAIISSPPAHPRMVDGKPSKNPRYLQKRPDLVNAREAYAGRNGDAPAAPHAAGDAASTRRSTPSCPAAATIRPTRRGHPLAGGVQSDSLHGIAGVVHGIHFAA